MLPQAVEIAGNNRHLCKERGFLAVHDGGERLGRIPLVPFQGQNPPEKSKTTRPVLAAGCRF